MSKSEFPASKPAGQTDASPTTIPPRIDRRQVTDRYGYIARVEFACRRCSEAGDTVSAALNECECR